MILYHIWTIIQILHLGCHALTATYLSALTSHTLPHSLSSTVLVGLSSYRHTRFIPTSESLFSWFPLPATLSPQTLQWLTHSLCSFLNPNITSSEKYLWLLSLKQPVIHHPHSLFFFRRVLLPKIPLYVYFIPHSLSVSPLKRNFQQIKGLLHRIHCSVHSTL